MLILKFLYLQVGTYLIISFFVKVNSRVESVLEHFVGFNDPEIVRLNFD